MNTAKTLYVLFFISFISVHAFSQSESPLIPKAVELVYSDEYDSFVQNYNSMVDVMLNLTSDRDLAIIMNSKAHLQFLKQAQKHLNNCISIAPKDKQVMAMLKGYQERLEFLEIVE